MEATKLTNKSLNQVQKDSQKRVKDIREAFLALIKDIIPFHTGLTDAYKSDKNDLKLLNLSKAASVALKERTTKMNNLQSVNRGLQEKLKASEQSLKEAANIETNLFASKYELEKDLMTTRRNLAEQGRMNEELVQMLEKMTSNE